MMKNIACATIPPQFPAEILLIERPAVDKLLKDAFEKPITTVVAGAGYGKTQAVLSALKKTQYSYAWVQLTETDNHVLRFWERVSRAFKLVDNDLYEKLISLGYPESVAAFDRFLCLITKPLEKNGRFVLVLDDFHSIQNKTLLNFINIFMLSGTPNLSIVLVSRKKLNISLTGILSKGLLSRITENDLRFSITETEEYFQKQGIEFDSKTLSNIHSYTNGWVLACCLIGLGAKNGTIGYQNPVLSIKLDIFDLIEKEIFETASEAVKKLLIKLSVLNVIPSGLFTKFAYGDPALVNETIQTILFINYDPVSDVYRMHGLFRDFLREQRPGLTSAELADVHTTAAQWHVQNGDKSEALYHYGECGCYHEIFDIILTYSGQQAKETADMFIKFIEKAPSDVIAARPIMRVVKANYMMNNNKLSQAKRELVSIQQEYEAKTATVETASVLGEVYIALALLSIINSDYEFEALFKKADAYLPEGSRLINKKFTLAEGLNVCNISKSKAGELKKHENALFNIAPYAERVMNGCGYGSEYLNAAESALYVGDLKSAEKYAYDAIYRSKAYEQYDIEYMANLVLTRIFTAKGNYTQISNLLNYMGSQSDSLQMPRCVSLYDIIKSWFYVKIGKLDGVCEWIRNEDKAKKILAPVILGREFLVRSDCMLEEERYYELLSFMEQTDKLYKNRGILFAVIQNAITRAIVYYCLGEHARSIDALTEAYNLSSPDNLIMQFIEYGNKMRTLMYFARNNGNCKIPREWLNGIYTRSSSYAKMLSRIVREYESEYSTTKTSTLRLSKREAEVMEYLSQGMTREEIASTCYLSLSTINSVVKNIYNKLGASNIADAVRIVNEKNLI